MKQITLDQTWEYCIEMSTYIVENFDNNIWIGELKHRFIKSKGRKHPHLGCYFCEWASKEAERTSEYQCVDDECNFCNKCPARLVDPNFHCEKDAYCYSSKPDLLLAELRRLYVLRLS